MTAGPMRRVSVVGSSGSGKTTFGAQLAARLGVPHIELDAIWWGPNWTHLDAETFAAKVDAATAADAWVCDGNFSAVRPIVLERADTVVWLDLPLRTVLRRYATRTVRRITMGEELWSGNRERLRFLLGRHSLLWWILSTYRRRRREYPERLAAHPEITAVRLRSPREARAWLETLPRRAR